MIVTVTGTVVDATGRPDNSPWTFNSLVLREGTFGEVITTKKRMVAPSASALTVKLDSGPCVIEYAGHSYYVTVPEQSAVDLWDLIEVAVSLPPDSSQQMLEELILEAVTESLGASLAAAVASHVATLGVATLTGTQTLTNKTLTAPVLGGNITGTYSLGGTPTIPSPRINYVNDANGNVAFNISWVASAVNYLGFANAAAGGATQLLAQGASTDIGINLVPKGTGRVTVTNLTAHDAAFTAPRFDYLRATAGDAAISFPPVASAVNYLDIIRGATGNGVSINATGSDTNVWMSINPKGTGRVTVANLSAVSPIFTGQMQSIDPRINRIWGYTNNLEVIRFNDNVGAVNWWGMSNSATGGDLYLSASSTTDANVGITINPRGAGRVTVTNLTATNAVLTTPRADRLLDINGANILILQAAASAVNYLTLYNRAAGAGVGFFAAGTDSNIPIALEPKGSGNIQIYAATGQTPTIQAVGSDTNHHIVLQTKGTGALIVRTAAGASIFEASQITANTVNYVRASANATGAAPSLVSLGSDTNVGLDIAPKGTGRVTITNLSASNANLTSPNINTVRDSNGFPAITINTTATPVNYFFAVPGSAGSAISMRAIGADTDISIGYFSKGLGQIQLRSDLHGFAFAAQPVASGVNYLLAANAITGASPAFYATGTDSNIGVGLVPKGSGNVQIYAATGQTPTIQAIGADANHNLNLLAKGTGSVAVIAGQGNSALFSASASAVNYFQFIGSATTPIIQTIGTSATIDMSYRTKGQGAHYFADGNGLTVFSLFPVASAVNQIAMGNAISGAGPYLYATGSDANVSMRLVTKGAGLILAEAIIRHKTYTTAGRPSAATAGAGAEYYDTTISKPVYSDGTVWRDATGATV